MLVLSQFVLRLSSGLAFAMAITSPRKVTSGYFRNHSYVLLGLSVLATLAAMADRDRLFLWPAIAAALLSYSCSAVWLYEVPKLGTLLLWAVAAVSLVGAILDQPVGASISANPSASAVSLRQIFWLDPLTGGQLLGSTMAAMFLGQWYLNTPTMELATLRTLIRLMAIATAARAAVCAAGLMLLHWQGANLSTAQSLMVAMRWAGGILGVAVLTWMVWQTLKIPNTQSATGILYVAVIGTFIGELCGLLLSAETPFPV